MTLAITTRATTSGTETPRIAETVVPPTTAIAMTTGGNPTSDRATETTMRGRSAAVLETTGKPLMSAGAIGAMMHVGQTETATIVSAIENRETRSSATSACRADWSAKWFATDRVYDAYQTVVHDELESPLHPATIGELKWYFEHRDKATREPMHPQDQGFLDVGGRVFGAPRFTEMYRRWLKHGNAVFEGPSSPAIAEALLLADGVDIRIIQLMLGHASVQQTQRYLNVTDEELRKGLEVSWKRRTLKAVSGGHNA